MDNHRELEKSKPSYYEQLIIDFTLPCGMTVLLY